MFVRLKNKTIMEDKTDPICGMEGHIKVYGHYFCSPNCVKKYKTQHKMQPWLKVTIYIGIVLLLISLVAILQTTGYMIFFMGVFFVIVSLLKFADWKGFANAFAMYDVVAKRSKFYSYAYPLIELGLGAAYLFSWQITTAAIVTFVVMTVGSVGVAKNLLSKNPIKCACLGTLIKVPLTKFTLFEDILMAIMALMVLFL